MSEDGDLQTILLGASQNANRETGEREVLCPSLYKQHHGATRRDQEHHAGAASALSHSSPKNPASFFASQQAVLGEHKKKPASGKIKRFSDRREEIQIS